MAESSSSALCFSTFPSFSTLSHRFFPARKLSFGSCAPSSSSLCLQPSSSRWSIQCSAKDSDDPFGFYPWESSLPDGDNSSIQWVSEDRVTLFTTDGLVQVGGSLIPKRVSSSDKKQGRSKAFHKIERFQESDYMDPNQGLCLGALFDIAATNGLDMGRRLCIFGFCRSIEMLSDVVEETVLEIGGEIVATEKASNGCLQEKLKMTVAVPLLWGVPPASEPLHLAVRTGGGIIEKVYWQWNFL
ncbi:hypothetical protein C5167_033674 [Papaver somniferum]|uniref:DUF7811 domain-containing protein n=1 Tax=Papaver somniferum TaxID=3469 RepID=A0A4Y7KCD5_PAPSO|nr:uncharacterized protein LOC113298664 [Papaver somniferum]RZC70517.1 hypothetical protein C5167_033674 [Papaver somniferum]